MKKLPGIMFAIVLSAVLIAGCSKKDNPAAPIVATHGVYFTVEAVPTTAVEAVLTSAASIVYTSPDSHAVENAGLPWASPTYNMTEGLTATITVNCTGNTLDPGYGNTSIKLTIYRDGTAIQTGATQLGLVNSVATLSATI